MNESGFFGSGIGPQAIMRGNSAWYRAGGAPVPVAAYQPKGAASLAASYVNVVNPGTYDAAPGVAPSFNTATGWTFAAASNQYLNTGIAPNSVNVTVLVRFSGVTWVGNPPTYYGALIGSYSGGNRCVIYAYSNAATRLQFGNDGVFDYGSGVASGVAAFAGSACYLNGSNVGAISPCATGSTNPLHIGHTNSGSTPVSTNAYLNGTISHIAIWIATLTAPQMAAVSAAVAAL